MSGPLENAPVIPEVSYFLAHVPSMVRHGSKPSREISRSQSVLPLLLDHLETFEQAVGYPPNQVFIGNLDPDALLNVPRPWHQHPVKDSSRWGAFGELMPEEEFYGTLKLCDEFQLLLLEEQFMQDIVLRLQKHPLFTPEDIKKLDGGVPLDKVKQTLSEEDALPLYVDKDRLIGCCRRARGGGAEEDANLTPQLLLENLTVRASGVMALRNLLAKTGAAEKLDYLIGCGEEAVGDRYNRGGGNMAKAIGQLCGCIHATGSDTKAFCCGPVHALVLASGLVCSGIFDNVAVIAGGSFSKLGMKFEGHLRGDMPLLEDVVAGIAIQVRRNDGVSPLLRLASIGKHEIGSGSAQQSIIEKLVVLPLERLGMNLTDVAKYATEMHNPEITEPQGSGNVPLTNYRTIGSFAVMRKEISRDGLDSFVKTHGMPGFAPTQGHIASAVPVLGHALRKIKSGEWKNTMFLAKGSLFLGRVTQLSDGLSFLLVKNEGRK